MKIEIHSVTNKTKKTQLQGKMKTWEEQIQKQQRDLLVGSGAPTPTAGTDVCPVPPSYLQLFAVAVQLRLISPNLHL
jgi:hypothetical protein